ncbi:hypothetical protein C8J57DRAFT_1503820 [Mycena rebaudengoi]|nr:hypothetical protein C8J57DRAFT_1503820 [Mycena rebaudengoi]
MPHHKKAQLSAAARARVQRHPKATVTTKDSLLDIPNEQIPTSMEEIIPNLADGAMHSISPLDFFGDQSESESDCDYQGGVSVDFSSDSDFLPLNEADSDFTDSELSEFDDEFLEAVKAGLVSLAKPTPYEELSHVATVYNRD